MKISDYTLDETLACQRRLEILCTDRPLQTKEIFFANAYYGIDQILKEYAGLPSGYRLKMIVPHGICLGEESYWEAEAKALVPAVYCYPPYRSAIYQRATDKLVISSASPFLYLLRLLEHQPKPERTGTIVFPSHSTHRITVRMDFEALAEALVELDEEYHPITVCVYWRDFNLGHHLPFQERGLQVVSAGHMYDPYFLARLYHLCSMHRYAAGNGLGSHLFYSVASGCSYFHLDAFQYSVFGESQALFTDVASPSGGIEATVRVLFGRPRSSTTPEQRELVDYYLAAEYAKPSSELREQLLTAERLDRTGFVASNSGHRRLVIPPLYRRIPRELARAGRQWVKSAFTRPSGS